MNKIKAIPITTESFAPYGSFTSILNPTGNHLGDFYHDQVILPVSGAMPVAFSPLVIQKPEKMIVTAAEYHNTTGEGIVLMDDDAVIHVAPPSNHPVPELTAAFIVPKGTLVKLNIGVWHMGAIPVHVSELHVLIILPERIYKNDCTVVEYDLSQQLEIEI